MAEPDGNNGTPGQPTSQDNINVDKKPSTTNQKKKGNKNNSKSHVSTSKTSSFTGAMSELNGHVFELGSETTKTNQFNRTIEEVSNYMSRKYDYGGDIARMLRDRADVDLTQHKPVHPGSSADKTDLRIWEKQVDEYVKRINAYANNKEALFAILWGQCSDSMQTRLKTIDDFKSINEERKCLSLLTEIQGITYKFETQRYPCEALFDVFLSFYQQRQHRHQSNSEYHTRFKNLVSVIEHYGGDLGKDPILVKEALNRNHTGSRPVIPDPTSAAYKAAIPKARERFLAYAFLRCADPHRYRKMIADLSNQYSRGTIQFPDDITTAFSMLENYKDASRSGKKNDNADDKKDENDETADMSFYVNGVPKNKKNNKSESSKYSTSPAMSSTSNSSTDHHISDTSDSNIIDSSDADVEPPNEMDQAQYQQAVNFLLDAADTAEPGDSLDLFNDNLNLDYGFLFASSKLTHTTHQNLDHIFVHSKYLNKHWILLDNQSTVHIFHNRNLLTHIHPVPHNRRLICHSNGGS